MIGSVSSGSAAAAGSCGMDLSAGYGLDMEASRGAGATRAASEPSLPDGVDGLDQSADANRTHEHPRDGFEAPVDGPSEAQDGFDPEDLPTQQMQLMLGCCEKCSLPINACLCMFAQIMNLPDAPGASKAAA